MENINNCGVCQRLPYLAVTCHSCSISYCQECYQSKASICLGCRDKNGCAVNHDIRMKVERCGECFGNYLKGFDHKLTCMRSTMICEFCYVSLKRDELPLHYYNLHYKRILEKFGDPVFRIK